MKKRPPDRCSSQLSDGTGGGRFRLRHRCRRPLPCCGRSRLRHCRWPPYSRRCEPSRAQGPGNRQSSEIIDWHLLLAISLLYYMKICLEGIEIYSIHSACMYVYVYNITVDYVRLIKCFDIFKEYLYILYNI